VPRHDHRHHLQARELLSQASALVHDLVQALTSFYSRSEQRVKVFAEAVGEDVSDVNKQVVYFNTIYILHLLLPFLCMFAYFYLLLLCQMAAQIHTW